MKSFGLLVGAHIGRPPERALRQSTIVAVAGFAALCLFFSAWPIWRALFSMEIDLKEAWNAYHTDAVLTGGVLYPDFGGLTANNYPPLWYYLTAAVAWFGFDTIYLGRWLSFAAVLVLVAAIALCIRHFKAHWPGAILGGLFFFGVMLRYADWYVAMNDPNLLALAIMMVALAWFLRRSTTRGVEWPILLMVIGGFFKHVLLAIPTLTLFLLARCNLRVAARAAFVGGAAALAGLTLCTVMYGPSFLQEMFFYPREISLSRGWGSLARLVPLLPALLFWGIWVWHDRASAAARFSITFIGFTFVGFVIQKIGAGVDINAAFEFYVAVAVAIGLAFDRIADVPVFWAMSIQIREIGVIIVLALGLIAAPGIEPYLLLLSPKYRAEFFKNADVTRDEIKRIAAIPGLVHCDILSVCRAAGKPFVYDDFFIGQIGRVGGLTAAELRNRVDAVGFRVEAIDPRASIQPLQRQLFYGRSPAF